MSQPLSLLLLLTVPSIVFSVPNRPPSIYVQAPYDVYYKVGESVEIQCIADGVPAPRYNWTRNGRIFSTSGNDNRMVMLMDEGTIVMNKPQGKDEGIFQCLAYNHLGVSTSINVNFRQAMLEDFPGGKNEYISVERGRHVKLWCTPPTSIPRAEITWHIRDPETQMTKAINLNNRITMDLEGRLYITNVLDEDFQEGKPYICMATNYIMRKNTISPGKILRPIGSEKAVNVAPHYLWSTPNEVFGVLGEPLRIKCIFGGNPTPEVHWDNTSSGAVPDNRRTLSLGGQEVFIPQLQLSDRGAYTCYTTSPLGPRQQRTINVIVKSKPYWLKDGEPKDIETSVGAKATFICKAGGDPEPDIQWYINGQKFKDSKHITIQEGRLMKPDNHNITILNLRLGDAMVLQCNASNTYGYVYADFYLNVLKERPQFIKRPVKELKVAENTNVYLTCQTSGKPDPIITWFKGNQLLTGGRYQIQPNGDLLITNVVLSDAGNFTCTAENEEGFDSDWGVMIVRRATRIEQRPSDLEVNAGWDAKFTCSGTTDFEEVASLRVYWMKDSKDISTANQRMTTNVQDNSLTISGTIARDSGLYTCVVTNDLDRQTSSAILTVKDRPEAPLNIRTKNCTKNKVSVLWTKGGFNNAPIQFFEIQFNTSVEPDNWVFAAYANQSANTITLRLHPGVTYSFRVLATNKIGISDPSKQSDFCITNPSKPRKNPGNVRGVGDKANYLIVEWTPMPPIEHGGRDFRYILRIWRAGIQPFEYVKTIANWRQNRFELLRNDIYTPYNVTLEAFNEYKNADAELKPVVIYSAESKPDSTARVEEFVVDNAAMGDNSATFYWKWNMDKNRFLNGKLNGFKIQYWVKDMKQATFREDDIFERNLLPRYGTRVDPSTTEFRHTVENLLPYTYMEAQICVTNTYYVSGPSPIAAFVTKAGAPGPVENMHPVVIGSNFIELQWSQPELINSPVQDMTNVYLTGYDVGFQTVKGLNLGKMQEMDPQVTDPRVTKAVLNGLTAKTKYRVHMWARTAGGRGEATFIEITTAPTAGMNVPSFNILNVNQTFFNITWTMTISKKYGTIAFVEYRVKGTSDWQQSPQEVSKSWIGIGRLESGKSYEYRLAVTNGGKTSKSPIQIVDLKGLSFAFSLGSNLGWFLGLILSVLTIIALSILIVLRYKRRPEPILRKPYTAPPRKRDYYDDDGSKNDIVHKSSGSLNKGYDNYYYSGGDDPDDGYRNRDSYDDRRYSDRYDDDRRDDYDYNRPYDDDYYDEKKDYDRYEDDYKYDDSKNSYDNRRDDYYGDDRKVQYDKYGDDKSRYSDENRRYSDEKRRYSDEKQGYSDDEENQYRDDVYQSESRRPAYDRTPSYDKRTSLNEDVDLREPAKFDSDGYPIDDAAAKSPGKSSFV